MAEELATAPQPSVAREPRSEAPAGGVQVILDERDLRTIYVNGYRMHTLSEEVAIDLGFNMPNPGASPGQQQLLFKVTDRTIMSYSTAKRLALSLSQVVKRYEQQFGELPVAVAPSPRPQPAAQ